jgi:peptidyl-prolyl cis-trans isomerase B (cyclophilin B)
VASSNKRERELARAKYERQQARRAERTAAQRRRNQVLAVVAALVVVIGGVVALLLTNRDSGTVADGGSSVSPSPSTSVTPSTSPSGSTSPSASPSTTTSVQGCTTPPEPTVKTQTWSAPPSGTLAGPATITLATNCGDIVIETVDPAKAPKTTASMAFLASQGYYTDSACFRLTTEGIFVLQCGSPNNDGTGGPGYTVPDENLPADGANNYPRGTVAMANAGPGTAGSQFFIVYKDTTLGPDYTIWGTVVSGLDVVEKVAAAGTANGSGDGAPAQPIVITKATTSETPAG